VILRDCFYILLIIYFVRDIKRLNEEEKIHSKARGSHKRMAENGNCLIPKLSPNKLRVIYYLCFILDALL